jgi:hypothetical protein
MPSAITENLPATDRPYRRAPLSVVPAHAGIQGSAGILPAVKIDISFLLQAGSLRYECDPNLPNLSNHGGPQFCVAGPSRKSRTLPKNRV